MAVGSSELLPADRKDFTILAETFLAEKAIYESGYELNERPDWLEIPIRRIENALRKKL
jgi:maltose alpha-D-glucosyltransferase/alpha-amylase